MARADDDGAACAITADCSEGLRCVEGSCVSVSNGKAVAPMIVHRERSAGDRAWIGDGNGYVLQVVVGDLVAASVSAALVAITFATNQGWFAFAALFPTTLTAPIIHAAHGRGGPAAISFFGWAAVPPTATFFAALGGFGSGSGEAAVVIGYVIGIGASAGLTTLDAFFARKVNVSRRWRDESSLSIMPTIAPTRGGLTAGVVATF
jgi:hypothetical protein